MGGEKTLLCREREKKKREKKKKMSQKWKRQDFLELLPKKRRKQTHGRKKFGKVRKYLKKNYGMYMKHINQINTLAKMKNKKLKQDFINSLSLNEIKGIQEIARGIVNGDINMTPKEKSKLAKNKQILYDIVQNPLAVTKKKMSQRGGIFPLLPFLAPLAAKTLAPLAGSILTPLLGNVVKGILK